MTLPGMDKSDRGTDHNAEEKTQVEPQMTADEATWLVREAATLAREALLKVREAQREQAAHQAIQEEQHMMEMSKASDRLRVGLRVIQMSQVQRSASAMLQGDLCCAEFDEVLPCWSLWWVRVRVREVSVGRESHHDLPRRAKISIDPITVVS